MELCSSNDAKCQLLRERQFNGFEDLTSINPGKLKPISLSNSDLCTRLDKCNMVNLYPFIFKWLIVLLKVYAELCDFIKRIRSQRLMQHSRDTMNDTGLLFLHFQVLDCTGHGIRESEYLRMDERMASCYQCPSRVSFLFFRLWVF